MENSIFPPKNDQSANFRTSALKRINNSYGTEIYFLFLMNFEIIHAK